MNALRNSNETFLSLQDAYVEKSADDVDVSLCTSSSSLVKPRAERILNKQLKKGIPPPWGNNTADNWRNRFERKNTSACFLFVYLFVCFLSYKSLNCDEEAFAIFNILRTATISPLYLS